MSICTHVADSTECHPPHRWWRSLGSFEDESCLEACARLPRDGRSDDSTVCDAMVWREAPARYREEAIDDGHGTLLVRDGVLWWSFNELMGSTTNERDEDPRSSGVGGEYGDPA
jgi:hypothetical protein